MAHWDLASRSVAPPTLIKFLNTVSDVNSRLFTYELFRRRATLILDRLIVLEYVRRLLSWDKFDSLPSGVQWYMNKNKRVSK